MKKVYYIIVDQDGEEIYSASEREARIAFRSGGIVTIVHETIMYVDNVMVSTRIFIEMKE